jgi:teichuronic acid biosynthesis glycosyltransferase TuaG
MSPIGIVQYASARMSTGESVSVVIPAYNAAATIARAIESVLAQTHPVLDVLVCDDGSTDDTRDVVAGLQQPAVKWVPCGRNFGPGKPRNMGAAMAQGDWLCFLDSDDSWLPTKLQKQFAAHRETGCQLIATNAFVLRDGTIASQLLLRHPPARVGFEGLLHDNVIVCSSVMVSREVWLRTQGFPETREMSAVEDYVCWLQCLLYTDACIVGEPLVVYSDTPATSLRSRGVQTLWGQRALVFGHVLQQQKALGANADDTRFRTLRRHWLKAVRKHHGWRAWLSASAATPRD